MTNDNKDEPPIYYKNGKPIPDDAFAPDIPEAGTTPASEVERLIALIDGDDSDASDD